MADAVKIKWNHLVEEMLLRRGEAKPVSRDKEREWAL